MLYGYRQFHCLHKNRLSLLDIAECGEKRFDTSSYGLNRPLPKGENKKAIRLKKDELGGKIITKFVGLRAK